jgi:hypothetical protein
MSVQMPLLPPQLIKIGHESIRPQSTEMKNFAQRVKCRRCGKVRREEGAASEGTAIEGAKIRTLSALSAGVRITSVYDDNVMFICAAAFTTVLYLRVGDVSGRSQRERQANLVCVGKSRLCRQFQQGPKLEFNVGARELARNLNSYERRSSLQKVRAPSIGAQHGAG